MKRKTIAILGLVLILVLSFVYVTASGIIQLSNEKILFLYLDETTSDPGTVEVASLALFKDAHLQQDLIKVNPLSSTQPLQGRGISLSDCLMKANSVEEGVSLARTIAEEQTHTRIDRVVLVDSRALASIIDSFHPIPVDKAFRITPLDEPFELHIVANITGDAAEALIKGTQFPGVDNEDVLAIPEDYLWEIKAEVINDVTEKIFDFDQYTKGQQSSVASSAVGQYRKDFITVHQRNAVLSLLYYLPEAISRQIVRFALRLIV